MPSKKAPSKQAPSNLLRSAQAITVTIRFGGPSGDVIAVLDSFALEATCGGIIDLVEADVFAAKERALADESRCDKWLRSFRKSLMNNKTTEDSEDEDLQRVIAASLKVNEEENAEADLFFSGQTVLYDLKEGVIVAVHRNGIGSYGEYADWTGSDCGSLRLHWTKGK